MRNERQLGGLYFALVQAVLFPVGMAAQDAVRPAANPVVHPLDADLIAFEQVDGDQQELWFRRQDADTVFPLRVAATGTGVSMQLEGRAMSSYSGSLDWRPVFDDRRLWFAYVATSEDASGLGLYINYLDRTSASPSVAPLRVPVPGNANAISPRWSPDGRHLAFISNNTLYLVPDIIDGARVGDLGAVGPVAVQPDGGDALAPAWSPFGDHVAYQVETVTGGVRNWTIMVQPVDTITGRPHGLAGNVTSDLANVNKYRPSWSLDGKYIAFYQDRPGSEAGDRATIMDIGVVEPLVDSRSGTFSRGRILEGLTRRIAERVLPNANRGPEWTVVSEGGSPPVEFPALVYAKQDEETYNPVVVAAVEQWTRNLPRSQYEITISREWGTVNHKMVSMGELTGRLRYAFVAQSQGADVLMVEDIDAPWIQPVTPPCLECSGVGLGRRVALSLIPGGGHYATGRWQRGGVLSAVAAGGVVMAFLANKDMQAASTDAIAALAGASAIWKGGPGYAAFDEARKTRDSARKRQFIGLGLVAVAAVAGMIDNATYDPRPQWQQVALDVRPAGWAPGSLFEGPGAVEVRIVLRH